MNDLKEVIEKITDTIDDAGRLYGERWDSSLVGGEPNYHAITSEHTQDIVVRAADDSRHSSWLCDYLEAVSPANVRLLLAAMKPAPVVPDDVSGPLAHAYKELTPTFMRNHIAVFERYGIAPNDSSTVIQALRIALDGIERRAAMLAAVPQPVPVIRADLSEEDMEELMRDLAVSRPDGIIVTPRQQPEPVAWQCLRKGPGRFVVTLERAVADEWARKGWPVRALCECNSQSAFVSATDYLRDRAKDPE